MDTLNFVYTIIATKFEFDHAKDAKNIAKHGVSLGQAESLEWNTLIEYVEQREDYGETRYVGFALKGMQLYCVVYTERGDTRRIISLRKATNHEIRRYVSEN
jgi:hypothetical protein